MAPAGECAALDAGATARARLGNGGNGGVDDDGDDDDTEAGRLG